MGGFYEKTVDVNAYVLPTIASHTAYVDVDIDEYAKKHGKSPNELMINVYSPEKLSEGELAEISRALDEEWSKYICRREFSRETFRWLKWMALVEGCIGAGMVASDFFPIYPTTGLLIFYRVAIDMFFWVSLIFGPVTLAGIRVLVNYGREKRARELLKNWRNTNATEGLSPEKEKIVKQLSEYFSGLDGKEIDVYKKMKDYCKEHDHKAPYEFYKYKIEDLEKEESFYLKYRPTTLKKKIKNLFLGPKVVSPKIMVPMRRM